MEARKIIGKTEELQAKMNVKIKFYVITFRFRMELIAKRTLYTSYLEGKANVTMREKHETMNLFCF